LEFGRGRYRYRHRRTDGAMSRPWWLQSITEADEWWMAEWRRIWPQDVDMDLAFSTQKRAERRAARARR
jgi:hypothetical protein